jgi:dihydroorotate dehydrogenase (NAD+) catalytic subunit
MPIELVLHNKHGLTIDSPLIAGAGAVGFADAWPPGVTASMFGAIVTPPLTWRGRRGQAPPRLAETPAGFVLAAGDHNPGYRRVIEDHALDWRRLGTPVIMALAASAPDDWDRLAAHVEEEPCVAGIELHVPEGVRSVDVNTWVSTVRRATTLPLLVKLPSAQSTALAQAATQAGADALVIGTPPLASAPALNGDALVEGPIAGPVAFPFTLRALRAVAALGLGLPLIASGGICRAGDAGRCFDIGAVAVQIRSLLWTDPAAAVRLAEELREGGISGALPYR